MNSTTNFPRLTCKQKDCIIYMNDIANEYNLESYYDQDGLDVFFYYFKMRVTGRACHTARHEQQFAGPLG